MTEDVKKDLDKQELSKAHSSLLTHAMALVKKSRSDMSKYYSDWDLHDQVFRGERKLDDEDVQQLVNDKPVKMVVPNTFAQVMTFVSFLFLQFNQNRLLFELEPSGTEDSGNKKKDLEQVLQHNVRAQKMNNVLFQHLLDLARFGPAIIETGWTKTTTRVWVPPTTEVREVIDSPMSVAVPGSWNEYTKYEGNVVRAVSPYRFFPDTRLPLVDFARGEFCAAEEEYSLQQLRQMELAGEVAGVERIQPLTTDRIKERGVTRSPAIESAKAKYPWQSSNTQSVALVTKCQIWIVPSKFEIDAETKLGPEEFPVLYHLWYANDNRIIRLEPAYYWHNEFSWSVAQFTPDMHTTLSTGLADLVYRLQDVISWFVNSHVTSVRRVMQNRFVVNPAMIDTTTLDGEGDIYLRKGVNGALMDRALMQLKVQDVTAGHMNDVDTLSKMMQMVTGVNDNAMGQYNSGRRSATEARNVTSGAAGRLKMHGHLIWDNSLSRTGQQMISNLRQSLSQEVFARVVGGSPETLAERYAAFRGTPEEVACGSDYFLFDSTLASERGYMAQSLQELAGVLLSNPEAAQIMDLDPKPMIEEIQYLRGAGRIERFSLRERLLKQQQEAQQNEQQISTGAAPNEVGGVPPLVGA